MRSTWTAATFCAIALSTCAARGDGLQLDKSAIFQAAPQAALDLRDEVTLEAWIQADRMPSAGGHILDKTIPGTQVGYMLDTFPGNSLRLLNATGMCRFRAELPADQWTHVAGVFSASKKIMKLYVNGATVASLDGNFQPMEVSNAPLCVGADPRGGNRFQGRIRRAAIYNRALTDAEIHQRAAAEQPATLDGVLGQWQFEAKPGRQIKPLAGEIVLTRTNVTPGFSGSFEGDAAKPEDPFSLWYERPATQWSEALPIGNGRLGAMVFGGVDNERIQFNEDTLWTGQPHEYQHDGAVDHLPRIRQLLAEGKQREAENLAMQEFMSDPIRQKSYQPFGDIFIVLPATRHRRRLRSRSEPRHGDGRRPLPT